MGVTIQQIADKAGVSRGTVDRALNNRGRINPEVEKKICEIAADMGYVRKSRRKKDKEILQIGVVTQLSNASFMLEVNRGISQAKEELEERGVKLLLKAGISVDEDEQLEAIDELMAKGIAGLAIMPVESERIRSRLNELTDQGIPVVTFNSDIVGTKRSCFVGMDNKKSGQTAAGLMKLMTGGVGKVLIITGFFSNQVDNARVDGFIEECKRSSPGIEIAGVQSSFDETDEVEKIIYNNMMAISGITGILVVSGGQAGVAKAFRELGLEHRPYVIIYDQTPKNERALREDSADFLIDQNGYLQGYRPPFILADLLLKGKMPDEELNYTEIRIKTKYNL